ncbi:MAG: acyl-CoA reductase [Flavobacteriales bacterium]|nr:acyl-CoA reductase [Flavobacteriales bacterium]
MQLERKIEILTELGEFFKHSLSPEKSSGLKQANIELKAKAFSEAMGIAFHSNAWFTKESVRSAVSAWAKSLEYDKVSKWLSVYDFNNSDKTVGLIMAGNIPLVGLHDLLCVLISGHRVKVKLSSKDNVLMTQIVAALQLIAPELEEKIELNVQMKGLDYLIATGSDNSARYFDYYFKDVTRIIRKNRTSVAIIQGDEKEEELSLLADDIFGHFGLGCRNVTKVYVPQGYDLDLLFKAFFRYQDIANHNKYGNNYDYNKAVYLLNKIDLIENGFLLLKEDENIHSPVGVLFYEYYNSLEELSLKLNLIKDQIQCKVASIEGKEFVPFGKAQSPELWDYADGVDTIKFLSS